MNNNKGQLVTIIFIVFLVALVVGAFLFFSGWLNPKPIDDVVPGVPVDNPVQLPIVQVTDSAGNVDIITPQGGVGIPPQGGAVIPPQGQVVNVTFVDNTTAEINLSDLRINYNLLTNSSNYTNSSNISSNISSNDTGIVLNLSG